MIEMNEKEWRKRMDHLLVMADQIKQEVEGDPLLTVKLHEKQKAFVNQVFNGVETENWLFTSNRWGKSIVGAYCGSTMARFGNPDDGKPTGGWVVSVDSNASRDIIEPMYFDNGHVVAGGIPPFIPESEILEWRIKDKVLKLKNGSIIGFKCIRGDQEVLMADGTYKAIKDIKEGDRCSVRHHFGRGGIQDKTNEVLLHSNMGIKKLIKIRIGGGREIVCTPEHQIFNGLKWKEAGQFKKGDTIPYYGTPEPENTIPLTFSPWMLGFLIGDGGFRSKDIRCTIFDAIIKQRVIEETVKAGYKLSASGNKGSYRISRDISTNGFSRSNGNSLGITSPMMDWLKLLGVWGLKSKDKFVPEQVFSAPNEQVKEFLSGLFAADGTITKKPTISLSTASHKLAKGVQRLLDRIRIKASVWYVRNTKSWRVVTQGRHPTAMFLDEIEWVKYPEKAKELRNRLPVQPHTTPFHVKEIIKEEPAEVYDMAIPNQACYMVSGFPVHNSCESKGKKFPGVARDWIHFDEPPDKFVYDEAGIRVGAGKKLRLFGTCTLLPPEGTIGGISWLYNEIVKREPLLPHVKVFTGSIYDNPYLEQKEIDILEARYPVGTKINRIRLQGELLPGIGGSRVYSSFDRMLHVKQGMTFYNKIPLAWIWDFNVEPMVSYVGQKHGNEFKVFQEFVLDEGNIFDMVERFRMEYPTHGAEVHVYGDATGSFRDVQTNSSNFNLILRKMSNYPVPVKLKIPAKNPNVQDRINAMNTALKDEIGAVNLCITPECPELIQDFEEVLSDNAGGIKKTKNPRDPYYKRTHMTDAIGYWVAYEAPAKKTSFYHLKSRVVIPPVPKYAFN